MTPKTRVAKTQQEFEQVAFAYGIQPAVCTLLAEFMERKIEESWQDGQREGWSRAYDTFVPARYVRERRKTFSPALPFENEY